MSHNPEVSMPAAPASTTSACPNCHSIMPMELRFCRNCGFRLGGGSAEYVETVPFYGAPAGMAATSLAPRKRRRMSGMAWIFVGLLVFFIGAAAFTAIVAPMRNNNAHVISIAKPKSYAGVDDFNTVDDDAGVTFESVDAPDGPADKAGLVGGDIITSFDGQAVHNDDEISDLMERTPIGKTVDVEYLRDGEKKTTKLTTISRDEFNRLTGIFNRRPEGRGQFGYEDGDAERVEIPGTKMFGVKLNELLQSRAADLAGIKEGDIVIEFDKIPIRTRGEFLMRVRRALPYSTVNVVVIRDGQKLTIPVKMGKQ